MERRREDEPTTSTDNSIEILAEPSDIARAEAEMSEWVGSVRSGAEVLPRRWMHCENLIYQKETETQEVGAND